MTMLIAPVSAVDARTNDGHALISITIGPLQSALLQRLLLLLVTDLTER